MLRKFRDNDFLPVLALFLEGARSKELRNKHWLMNTMDIQSVSRINASEAEDQTNH